MKINYSHIHLCKTCHGMGMITPPAGTRATFFPCERCMGRGTIDENDIVSMIVDAIRPYVMQRCRCSETYKQSGMQADDCGIHDLDIAAMAQAAIQVAARYD
ncbi:MAG: hypothetical protein HQL74_09670 [Magnetococcales bacterium]|nr:hypothetical protein [Magnetococcales bacterium]